MNNPPIQSYSVNEDFKILIQPKSDDYFDKLEETIFDNGCHAPIEVWKNYIVDGHKRYDICKNWEIPFQIKKLDLQAENEIISYLCDQQLKRDDLTDEYRRYLFGRQFRANMETASAKFMKENPEQALNAYGQVSQKYVKKYKIAGDISKAYGLHYITIIKYSVYSRALDDIRTIEPDIANKILMGKLRVSHDNTIEIARLPKEEILALKQLLNESGIKHIVYSQLRHDLQRKRFPTEKPCKRIVRQRKKNSEAKIKQIPAIDPNAELSSLQLTIPSWNEIINRSIELTDFSATSEPIRKKLIVQLAELSQKTGNLIIKLEEI